MKCFSACSSTIIVSLSLLVFSASCHKNHPIDSSLDDIEQIIDEKPDSALVKLEELYNQTASMTEEQWARYALLKSKALDKNYIDVQDDSLTQIAVSFYSKGSDRTRRMESFYYDGIVQKNAGNYSKAIVSLEKALRDAEVLHDDYRTGLICRNKASIYGAMNNFSESIEWDKRAVEAYLAGGKNEHAAFATLSLAIDYFNNRDYSLCEEILNTAGSLSDNEYLLSQIRLRKAALMVERFEDPSSSIQLFQTVSPDLYDLYDYGYLAIAYERRGQRDSADHWMNLTYAHAINKADSASVDYMKSRIESNRGNYENAFRLVDDATTVQDSFTQTILQESLNSALKGYYQDELNLEEAERKRLQERVLWGSILLSLAVMLGVVYLIARARKKDKELTDIMCQFTIAEKQRESVMKENASLVGSLLSERLRHLNQLSHNYFTASEKEQKELVFKTFKKNLEQVRNDDTIYLSLEQDLNRYCNEVVFKFRSQVPNVQGWNFKILLLFFTRLPYDTIGLITKRSIQSLRMLRSRIRKEISEAKAPDAELFLSLLEMKKRLPGNPTNEG